MGNASASVGEIWDGRYRTVSEMAPMYLPPDTPDNQAFLVSFGRAIMAWNTLDGVFRQFLEVLSELDGGCGRATFIALSAETTTYGIEQAAAALSKVVLSGERFKDAEFAIDQVARIREHRNFYIHGANHLTQHDGQVVAPTLTWSAKRGKIKHNTEQIRVSDLHDLAKWSSEQSSFIKSLIDYWFPVEINGSVPPRPDRPEKVPSCQKSYRDITSYAFADPAKRSH